MAGDSARLIKNFEAVHSSGTERRWIIPMKLRRKQKLWSGREINQASGIHSVIVLLAF